MINTYQTKDMKMVIDLWNRTAVNIGYKEMNEKSFTEIILGNPYFHPAYTHVMREEDTIVGFACGCAGDDLPLGETSGYITCILLDEKYETSENYGRLIECLEEAFIKAGKVQAEILFFNPMMLPWYIKDTDHHEHNNAPGVFKGSRLHQELLQHGYHERATECAMYLNLKDFVMPTRIKEKEDKAAAEEYEVGLFDKTRHHGLEDMLKKLDNPLWEKEILASARENKPVLIASQRGAAVGFAGPVYRQESGRGYFTGIGVNKEHEGHGLGTILFYKLCEEERNAGALYMSLYTGETNPAGKIYLQAGFRTVQEFAVMRRILKQEA